MRVFHVLVAQANTPVDHVIADMVESHTPGALITAAGGEMRLVHFGNLSYVAASSLRTGASASLQTVPSDAVMDPNTSDAMTAAAQVAAHGLRFGLLSKKGNRADLVSVSEEFSFAFDLNTSLGNRCTLPGKPPGTPNGAWYHYYPPMSRQAAPNADRCIIDGYPIA